MIDDRAQRFHFSDTDIRGELVQLHDSYGEVLAANAYHPTLQKLLGEFLAASLLLSATIKFQGRLVLQMRSNGEVPMLMAEATHDKHVRGIIRPRDPDSPVTSDFSELFRDGTLAVTIENNDGERYQSLVPITGESLGDSLETYFAQSEQLSTSVFLAADAERAAGMLLQQLPAQLVTDSDERDNQWQHANILAGTVADEELLNIDSHDLLGRLFAEDNVQLSTRDIISFNCSCSAERIQSSILSLGADDVASLFEEEDTITVDCEFCGTQYAFTRDSLIGD